MLIEFWMRIKMVEEEDGVVYWNGMSRLPASKRRSRGPKMDTRTSFVDPLYFVALIVQPDFLSYSFSFGPSSRDSFGPAKFKRSFGNMSSDVR